MFHRRIGGLEFRKRLVERAAQVSETVSDMRKYVLGYAEHFIAPDNKHGLAISADEQGFLGRTSVQLESVRMRISA